MGKHWHIQLSHPTLGERQGFSFNKLVLTNKEECDLMKDCPSLMHSHPLPSTFPMVSSLILYFLFFALCDTAYCQLFCASSFF